MAVSEKKKATNAKWNREHMTILATTVRKEYAEQVKAACKAAGTSVHAVLLQATQDFLAAHPLPEAESPRE